MALTVAGGITRTKNGTPVAGHPGSRKAQPRVIPIGAKLANMLAEHMAEIGPGDLLFPDTNGNLMRYTNWYRREWLPALEEAQLADKLPLPGIHDLRRLNATHLAATTDVKTLMTRLGIKTTRVALNVYAKTIDERERQAAAAMEDFSLSHVGRTEMEEVSA
jgi:integrase